MNKVTLSVTLNETTARRLRNYLERIQQREDPGLELGSGVMPSQDDVFERALKAWFIRVREPQVEEAPEISTIECAKDVN